ncbi:SubName: Full=Uncharacterized protein {ECO:0000313/EMBL:CCA71574.1} [Serendipita indica DSM 11827]|uniref:Uncharacterized protein n=1 Tax=Serendipita indica (strain DSM 11827) TaxID=1109443 RepID=G4TJT1_SERID|nr:SubName: Full=Uncharacterized protein {ECO:0000313/EMBL:CCA71574.1} [Serendipita indica DSM 11827]CCA71574.1 hypothetical protein PIIN_05511 [Serendipita indica DSM 11827]
MSNQFKKKLIIRASGLAKGGTLLLTFKPLEDIGTAQQKVAWKVIPFATNTNKKAQAEYVNQLVFIGPQIDDDNLISPSTFGNVNVGGAVDFTLDSDKNLLISDTDKNKRPGFVVATNSTGKIQDIAIGLQPNPKKDPEAILYFPKIGNTSQVVCKYHPILRAYMTSDYQETEVISGEIQTGMIWERDLAQLEDTTNWRLTYNGSTGQYSLSPDEDS